jgi:hypothetical protein
VAESITRAEACRRNAEQCERTALLATDEGAKRIYTELARQWGDMAERAEVLARRLEVFLPAQLGSVGLSLASICFPILKTG